MSIDFLSTNENVDTQTQRCARLIAAVIAQALKDLTLMPSAQERKKLINTNENAIRSINFFRSETFLQYAAFVGMDGKEFLTRMERGNINKNQITEGDQRVMRARLRWRCSAEIPLHPTIEEDIQDEAIWAEEDRLAEERRQNERGKNDNRQSSQHAVDIDRIHRIRAAGGNKVDTQVSSAKRGNAKVP